MKWFKHATDAHCDAKLEHVLIRYGAEGYALYWYCVELIAGRVSNENLTFELEHDAFLLANKLKIDSAKTEEIMRFIVEIGLFQNNNGHISCLTIAKHLDERYAKTERLKGVIRAARGQPPRSKSLQTVVDGLKTVLQKSETVYSSRAEQSRAEQSREEYLPSPSGEGVDRERSPPVPYEKIVETYHAVLCPPLPEVEKLTKTRRGYLAQRWREDLTALDHWRNYFDFVAQSDFLMGRKPGRDGKPPFRADLEWITTPGHYAKIAENKYHDETIRAS